MQKNSLTTRYMKVSFVHLFARLTRATPSLMNLQIREKKSRTFITSCTNNSIFVYLARKPYFVSLCSVFYLFTLYLSSPYATRCGII
jgi:hypothetical protein